MDKVCANCQHWRKDSDEIQRRIGSEQPIGHCEKLEQEDGKPTGDAFFGSSGGEYEVSTRADFGCVLWQPRESALWTQGHDDGWQEVSEMTPQGLKTHRTRVTLD